MWPQPRIVEVGSTRFCRARFSTNYDTPTRRGGPEHSSVFSLWSHSSQTSVVTLREMWTALALHLAAAVLPRTLTPATTPVAPRPAIRTAALMTAGGDDDLSLDQIVAQVQSNMNEGELSTRGEGWFVGQASLVLGVLFAPAEPVAPVAELTVGLAAIATGLALGAAAVRDLGLANLTPWPKPLEGNQLQIEGVYSLCRHPMCAHPPLPMP